MSNTILRRLARTAIVGTALAGSALVAGASPAGAAGSGTCGADWQLTTIQGTVQFIYDANPVVQEYRSAPYDGDWWARTYQVFADFDNASSKGHGDGYLCVKTTGSSPGSDKQYCGRYAYPVCYDYDVVNINDNNSNGKATA